MEIRTIKITDNANAENGHRIDVDDMNAIADILTIANKSIEELRKNEDLLIFPHSFTDTKKSLDLKDDARVLCAVPEIGEDNRCTKLTLSTGNVMGFIGVGNTSIDIISRFSDKPSIDYFMQYMLCKVLSINLFNLNHGTSSSERAFDFLLFLFPAMLKEALSQGLYKEYRWFKRNDNRIRGAIDIGRHIRTNIPFAGNVAYNSREYSYDNRVTLLIRHTIEYINRKPFGRSILNNDEETRNAVRQIKDATPTYTQQKTLQIVSENRKRTLHPYYSKYSDLQRLCLQILRHETLRYGEDDKKIYGVLFDGSWLWEEYLAKLLKDYTHAENRTGKNGIYLFEKNKYVRYPDFYDKDKKMIVLDAKYKHLSVDKIDRDDMHQLISYMYIIKARQGAFISPTEKSDKERNKNIGTLNGYGGKISVLHLYIPQKADNMKEFCESIKKEEKIIIKEVKTFEEI